MGAVFHQDGAVDDCVVNSFGALDVARRAFGEIVDFFRSA